LAGEAVRLEHETRIARLLVVKAALLKKKGMELP